MLVGSKCSVYCTLVRAPRYRSSTNAAGWNMAVAPAMAAPVSWDGSSTKLPSGTSHVPDQAAASLEISHLSPRTYSISRANQGALRKRLIEWGGSRLVPRGLCDLVHGLCRDLHGIARVLQIVGGPPPGPGAGRMCKQRHSSSQRSGTGQPERGFNKPSGPMNREKRRGARRRPGPSRPLRARRPEDGAPAVPLGYGWAM